MPPRGRSRSPRRAFDRRSPPPRNPEEPPNFSDKLKEWRMQFEELDRRKRADPLPLNSDLERYSNHEIGNNMVQCDRIDAQHKIKVNETKRLMEEALMMSQEAIKDYQAAMTAALETDIKMRQLADIVKRRDVDMAMLIQEVSRDHIM